MELVVGSSASRTLLSLCLLLILLVLLQILYIQRSLLLNSFEMAKLPCANGSVHNVPAEPKDSNVHDVVLLDYKHRSLYNHKQLTIQLLNNKANLSKQTKQESHHPPNYLIIGVRKGGTRALLQTIALHPDVKVAKKEVHFFDRDQKYNLGKQWYSQQMPPSTPQQVVIEKTPAYFTSPKAPARVHSLNAQMKLILIVRDPVVRLISDFTQVYYNKLELNKTQVDFKKLFCKRIPVV